MGGPRAWKEIQQTQLNSQSWFGEESFQVGSEVEDEDNKGTRDKYADCDVEPETENERAARDGNDTAEDGTEDVSLLLCRH